ncbi:MAG: hypothetical protein WKF82_00630 [Nocardioidaceae bacterium]
MGHIFPTRWDPPSCRPRSIWPTAIIEVAALSFLGLGEDRSSRGGVGSHDRCPRQDRFELGSVGWRFYPGICNRHHQRSASRLLGEALREALDPKRRR